MRAVFFPEELHERAPQIFGHFCEEPGGEWLTLVDLVQAMKRGETVTVRAASESELKRADAYVALFEIGQMLGEKLSTLLDQDPPEDAAARITAFREAMEESDLGASPVTLLDVAEG